MLCCDKASTLLFVLGILFTCPLIDVPKFCANCGLRTLHQYIDYYEGLRVLYQERKENKLSTRFFLIILYGRLGSQPVSDTAKCVEIAYGKLICSKDACSEKTGQRMGMGGKHQIRMLAFCFSKYVSECSYTIYSYFMGMYVTHPHKT